MARTVLQDVRVLDHTIGIAGPYCTKMLADAGADVVKVEGGRDDPLRQRHDGALWGFLNNSKRSVTNAGDLAAAADLVVYDERVDVAALRETHPAAVVVTITPWGMEGPWADRPATEFTLQAVCGSTGNRGLPDQPPLAAGGQIGEWIAGSYAAAAALAAWREATRSGQGDHVDVAILDCMAVTMATYPSVFATFLGWPPMRGTGRTVEVPSIEPTTDGYAAFTTNSAQQFADLLALIGRPDLIGDEGLARVHTRFKRRDEFLAMVRAYTTERTTAQVLEEASALRIPSGPVCNAATVTEVEHFVARGIFVPTPSGRGVQPRVPYQIEGLPPRPFTAPPTPGEHDDAVSWPSRDRPRSTDWRLPLKGLTVIDCTGWWAGPMAPHILGRLGAEVIKVESTQHPDGMRMVTTRYPPTEQWWEWSPMFHALNMGKRGITLDLSRPDGVEVLERLIAGADILVENFTPRVVEQFGLGWTTVHALNPRLIMLRMPAFGLDGPWRDRTGFAQTMEAISGMAWVTGWPDGPPILARGPGDPIAGTNAVVAVLAALVQRDEDGVGRLVESVMVEGALNVAAEQVVTYGATGAVLTRIGNANPDGHPQGVYSCAGDDDWVVLSAVTDGQRAALTKLLGGQSPDDWCKTRTAEDAEATLLAAGIPAAIAIAARDIAFNPQLRARGLFEEEAHPVTGTCDIPSMPFRLSRVARWNQRPSPTLGQHTAEVLAEIGMGEAFARLEAEGVTGDRLR